jgi:hypothetical protein
MKFLLIIFLLFVFVFLFGFSILRAILSRLFGGPSEGRRKPESSSKAASSSKKIIASDEGEYVDYVEIKD